MMTRLLCLLIFLTMIMNIEAEEKNNEASNIQEQLYQKLDIWRQEQNRNILFRKNLLEVIAAKYGHEILKQNILSHNLVINGVKSSPLIRARAQGETSQRIGEVLAVAYTPDEIIGGWRTSPKHKDVILGKEWEACGLASLVMEDGRWLAVVVFASGKEK